MRVLLFIGTLISMSANAKTYFDQVNQRAVVYFKQGANVNASLCEEVDERELRRSLKDILQRKCKTLSDNGFSKQDIEPKLPQLKEQMVQALGLIGNMVTGFSGAIDDKDAENMIKNIFSSFLAPQKEAIEKLTANEFFEQFDLDARSPAFEKVKESKDLDTEIEQFLVLTSK